MDVEPLAKSIYDELVRREVQELKLCFSGGNDEGYLTTYLDGQILDYRTDRQFHDQIENWAFSAYSYSGAGDGTPYGDDITYFLKEMQTASQGWYTVSTKEFDNEQFKVLKLDESK